MRIISQYRNNRLFEVVRVVYNSRRSYRWKESLQVHTACGHSFHCLWKFHGGLGAPVDEGSGYYCPKCGKRLYKRDTDCPWIEVPESGRMLVPYSINLEAREYKNYLDIYAELNRALLAWAKSRKLTIETNDVQTEREVTGVAAAV